MYNNRNRDQQNDLSNFVVTKPANKKGPNPPQEEEYEDDYGNIKYLLIMPVLF
jgi:hypothetical protein